MVTKFSKTTSSLISNEFIPLGYRGENCKRRSLSAYPFRPGHSVFPSPRLHLLFFQKPTSGKTRNSLYFMHREPTLFQGSWILICQGTIGKQVTLIARACLFAFFYSKRVPTREIHLAGFAERIVSTVTSR